MNEFTPVSWCSSESDCVYCSVECKGQNIQLIIPSCQTYLVAFFQQHQSLSHQYQVPLLRLPSDFCVLVKSAKLTFVVPLPVPLASFEDCMLPSLPDHDSPPFGFSFPVVLGRAKDAALFSVHYKARIEFHHSDEVRVIQAVNAFRNDTSRSDQEISFWKLVAAYLDVCSRFLDCI